MEQISAACEQQQNENYAEIFGNKRKKENKFSPLVMDFIHRAFFLLAFIYLSII